MNRRAILSVLLGGLAVAHSCKGWSSHELDADRKVLARIETNKGMPIEVVAQKEGRHNGACASGGGRGGISIMPFDQYTYTVQVNPVRAGGKPTTIHGGGDTELFRLDSSTDRKDDPLGDVKLQQCSDAKSRRVVM